jgi:hypothetical protein
MIEITGSMLSSMVFVAAAKAAVPCMNGDTTCITSGNLSALDGLREVIRVLISGDGGKDSLFSIVLQPCKVFTGLGIIWGLAPLLNSSIDNIKAEFTKIITMFVLAVLLMGNGDVARGLGIANYATLRGIRQEISRGISEIAKMPDLIQNIANDKTAGKEINDKVTACMAIKSTIDSVEGSKPNPAYDTCYTELISLIRVKAADPKSTLKPGLDQFVSTYGTSARARNAKEATQRCNYST